MYIMFAKNGAVFLFFNNRRKRILKLPENVKFSEGMNFENARVKFARHLNPIVMLSLLTLEILINSNDVRRVIIITPAVYLFTPGWGVPNVD